MFVNVLHIFCTRHFIHCNKILKKFLYFLYLEDLLVVFFCKIYLAYIICDFFLNQRLKARPKFLSKAKSCLISFVIFDMKKKKEIKS